MGSGDGGSGGDELHGDGDWDAFGYVHDVIDCMRHHITGVGQLFRDRHSHEH